MSTDEEIMLTVAGGDTDAFEEIVLRHQKSAWSVAYRFLGEVTEAEDVVQDAFLKIFVAAPRYRPTAKFSTFLYRVVSRLCMDRARKMHPIYTDAPPDITDPTPSAASFAVARDRVAEVQHVLARLPEKQRIAVILRHYEGLDYRSIAASLEITEKAVERLLARGREQMRKELASLRDDVRPEGDLAG